jgi:hypothetical protein
MKTIYLVQKDDYEKTPVIATESLADAMRLQEKLLGKRNAENYPPIPMPLIVDNKGNWGVVIETPGPDEDGVINDN